MRQFLILLILTTSNLLAQSPIQVSETPVSPESVSIYRDFLKGYLGSEGGKLHLAKQTKEFQSDEMDQKSCLQGFPKTRSAGTHSFGPEAFKGLQVNLVDPRLHEISDPGTAIRKGESIDDAVRAGFDAALFTFSEIIFDKSHTHAAFSYSFHCGRLCGHGGTVIYELRKGAWQKSKNSCSTWIS